MKRVCSKRSCQRGAVLVETVLVVPFLVLLVSGVLVTGFGWKGKMTVETAGRAGVRTAVNLGNDSLADYNAIQTVLSGMGGIPTANIDRIVVFKANSSGVVPASCLSSANGVTNVCNIYSGSSLSAASSAFGCGGTKPDRFWCPTARVTAQSAANGPDYLGIYIKARPPYVPNMYGLSIDSVSSTVVMRLEPA